MSVGPLHGRRCSWPSVLPACSLSIAALRLSSWPPVVATWAYSGCPQHKAGQCACGNRRLLSRRAHAAAGCPSPASGCRAAIAKDGPPAIPYQSLYEMFQASVQKFPNNNCLGRREGAGYSWLTYKQTSERVADIGAALVKVGLKPHGRVGVYGANSPEWMIAMQVGAGCTACLLVAGLRPCQCSACASTVLRRKLPMLAQGLPIWGLGVHG